MKTRFIDIEGGEGSGKTTLLAALKETYGDSVTFTREPGGSPYGEAIREMALKNPLAKNAPAMTTLLLMFASRCDHIQNTVMPSLRSVKPVITDRFDGSSYAYNIWAQANENLESLFWELRSHLSVLPTLYIYLDVDPAEGIRRVRSRNESSDAKGKYDHFDDRDVEFHAKVREGYLQFFKGRNTGRIRIPHVVINANRPLEIVKLEFLAEIKKHLGQ